MKLKALVTAEVIKENLEVLSDKIDFVYDGYNLDHDVMPHTELAEKISDYDILICEYDTIDKLIIDNAKNLKLIICCRGGVKSVVDLDYCKEKGIIVCNNGGRNASAVSDMVLGYMIDMTRNITKASNLIHGKVITSSVSNVPGEYRDTVWGLDKNSPFVMYRGKSLNFMTLGLVGCGFVGRLVAEKAKAFGTKVIAYDPYIAPERVPEYVELISDFDEFLKAADIISLHCVVTAENEGLFCKKTFDKMKDGAYFINTARGALVNEDDLVDALKSGKLSGAALDVMVKEPIPSDSPLVGAPNLLVTPHIGGSSYDVQVTGTRMVVESLSDFLSGGEMHNCVVGK